MEDLSSSWGSGIRTPISTSRAWRAAVAPIPKATGILPLNQKLIGNKDPLFEVTIFVPRRSMAVLQTKELR